MSLNDDILSIDTVMDFGGSGARSTDQTEERLREQILDGDDRELTQHEQELLAERLREQNREAEERQQAIEQQQTDAQAHQAADDERRREDQAQAEQRLAEDAERSQQAINQLNARTADILEERRKEEREREAAKREDEQRETEFAKSGRNVAGLANEVFAEVHEKRRQELNEHAKEAQERAQLANMAPSDFSPVSSYHTVAVKHRDEPQMLEPFRGGDYEARVQHEIQEAWHKTDMMASHFRYSPAERQAWRDYHEANITAKAQARLDAVNGLKVASMVGGLDVPNQASLKALVAEAAEPGPQYGDVYKGRDGKIYTPEKAGMSNDRRLLAHEAHTYDRMDAHKKAYKEWVGRNEVSKSLVAYYAEKDPQAVHAAIKAYAKEQGLSDDKIRHLQNRAMETYTQRNELAETLAKAKGEQTQQEPASEKDNATAQAQAAPGEQEKVTAADIAKRQGWTAPPKKDEREQQATAATPESGQAAAPANSSPQKDVASSMGWGAPKSAPQQDQQATRRSERGQEAEQ